MVVLLGRLVVLWAMPLLCSLQDNIFQAQALKWVITRAHKSSTIVLKLQDNNTATIDWHYPPAGREGDTATNINKEWRLLGQDLLDRLLYNIVQIS